MASYGMEGILLMQVGFGPVVLRTTERIMKGSTAEEAQGGEEMLVEDLGGEGTRLAVLGGEVMAVVVEEAIVEAVVAVIVEEAEGEGEIVVEEADLPKGFSWKVGVVNRWRAGERRRSRKG